MIHSNRLFYRLFNIYCFRCYQQAPFHIKKCEPVDHTTFSCCQVQIFVLTCSSTFSPFHLFIFSDKVLDETSVFAKETLATAKYASFSEVISYCKPLGCAFFTVAAKKTTVVFLKSSLLLSERWLLGSENKPLFSATKSHATKPFHPRVERAKRLRFTLACSIFLTASDFCLITTFPAPQGGG